MLKMIKQVSWWMLIVFLDEKNKYMIDMPTFLTGVATSQKGPRRFDPS